jgi:hypothetical protein
MFASLKRPCMDSSMHQKHCIPGLMDGYLQSVDFTKSEANPNLYYIFVGTNPLILMLYIMTCFLQVQRSSLLGAKQIWQLTLK